MPLATQKTKHQKKDPLLISKSWDLWDSHYTMLISFSKLTQLQHVQIPCLQTRDTLYQSLTPNFKASLRSKTHFFHLEKKPNVADVKDEMEKTLCWLVPMATNTVKAHHGFGWVGEWANTGTVGAIDVMQMETLHHADRQKTEAYILELLLWLNYLLNQSKSSKDGDCIVRIDTLASFSQNSSRANNGFQHDTESSNQDQEISKA